MKEDSRVSINRDHAGHGSYELTIHKVADTDAGMYKAVAENSHGKAETEAKVGIKGKNSFIRKLELLFY